MDKPVELEPELLIAIRESTDRAREEEDRLLDYLDRELRRQ